MVVPKLDPVEVDDQHVQPAQIEAQFGDEVPVPLAAIRMLCDWLVVSQVLPVNPVGAVRGPKHVVTKGSAPVLSPAEAKKLLEHIETGTLAGLRDRALVSVMLYSFARVSAVLGMVRTVIRGLMDTDDLAAIVYPTSPRRPGAGRRRPRALRRGRALGDAARESHEGSRI